MDALEQILPAGSAPRPHSISLPVMGRISDYGRILRAEDIVFSDSANHASLVDGMRLAKCRRIVVPHLHLNVLNDELAGCFSCPGAIHRGREHFQHGRRPCAARRARRACCRATAPNSSSMRPTPRAPADRTARLRRGSWACWSCVCYRPYLRESARGCGGFCVRFGTFAPFPDQPCTHFHFQYGSSAVLCLSSRCRNASGR